MYFARNNRPKTIAAPETKKIVPKFGMVIDQKTGKKELKKVGETNIYEKIQASKDSTMIYNIIDRFNAGDLEALNKVQGTYGDFTNLPTNLAEAQQRLIDAENMFKELPLEVRKEFNHSTTEFLASIANNDFAQRLEKLKVKEPKKETKQQPEGVKSNE